MRGRLPLHRWIHRQIPSASGDCQGQSQCQKKRRVIGTVLTKPTAQSQTTPEEPSLGELEAPFTLVRCGESQSRLAEADKFA